LETISDFVLCFRLIELNDVVLSTEVPGYLGKTGFSYVLHTGAVMLGRAHGWCG